MDTMLLRIFQQQVLLQCQFFQLAAYDLNASLVTKDRTRSWHAIQSMLTATACIAKALWGQSGGKAEERRALRESIGVDDDSPLRNCTMRNNFEHIDERIERWWAESANHNIIDLSFGSIRQSVRGLNDIEIFRIFDPGSGDVMFWSQDFNLQRIAGEIERILPKLWQEASKPHWDPRPAGPPESASDIPPGSAKAE